MNAMNQGQSVFLTPGAASAMLGVSVSLLEKYRAAGEGPPAHKVGKRGVRYLEPEILAWVASRSGGRRHVA